MKKFSLITLAIIVLVSLTACGRKNNTPSTTAGTTAGTTAPATTATIIPTDPMTTNIPDPSVDTSMPDMTDGTDTTIFDGTTESTGK